MLNNSGSHCKHFPFNYLLTINLTKYLLKQKWDFLCPNYFELGITLLKPQYGERLGGYRRVRNIDLKIVNFEENARSHESLFRPITYFRLGGGGKD